MTVYEYPFNERIRSYLRLEHLFDRLFFFAREGCFYQHQIAVLSLFDLLDTCERVDVKSVLLQDLDRQRLALLGLREHPGVAQDALEGMLSEIENATQGLNRSGKIGQALRDHEWLMGLKSRLSVSNAALQVDIPSYYAWQQKAEHVRCADLQKWAAAFVPLYEGLRLVLRLLRESGRKTVGLAEQGTYQQMLSGKQYQLLRVWMGPENEAFPEISANKYMIWIKFFLHNSEYKPQALTASVQFQIALCNF